MAKIVFSPAAVNDLKIIFDYISNDSAYYAENVVERIVKRTIALERHPRLGKVVREFNNDNVRKLLEGSYRIIYRIESDDEIAIARIYHGAQLLKKL